MAGKKQLFKRTRRRKLSTVRVLSLIKEGKSKSVEGGKSANSIVLPPPPSNLNKMAQGEWRLMGAKLIESGLFELIDVRALALYCETYAEWISAGERFKKSNQATWLLNKKTGSLYRNPLANEVKSARRDYQAALAMFGLSPGDRANMGHRKAQQKRPEPNAFDEF